MLQVLNMYGIIKIWKDRNTWHFKRQPLLENGLYNAINRKKYWKSSWKAEYQAAPKLF